MDEHRSLLNADLEHIQSLTTEILDSLPSLYYLVKPDGQIVRWNRNSCTITGYSNDEHSEMNILALFDDAGQQTIRDGMMRVFTDGYGEAETDILTKDGRRLPYLFSGKRIVVDGQAYLSGLGLDIRRQKDLERRLERQARVDQLTGLPNRVHFFERFDMEIAHARRSDRPLSLLMLDIDFFKSVNDTHGHLAGDAVLRAVGASLAGTAREVDLCARLGGEEFGILLHETTLAEALVVAERMRTAVSDQTISLEQGPTLRVTVSVGITVLSAMDTHPDQIIERADRALYAAKRDGRNRVAVEAPLPLTKPA